MVEEDGVGAEDGHFAGVGENGGTFEGGFAQRDTREDHGAFVVRRGGDDVNCAVGEGERDA